MENTSAISVRLVTQHLALEEVISKKHPAKVRVMCSQPQTFLQVLGLFLVTICPTKVSIICSQLQDALHGLAL